MINIINNKTLYELQLEHGFKSGLELFLSRCTGKSTGEALIHVGQLMAGKKPMVDLKFCLPEVRQYIAERIDQMGLVGFRWEGSELTYTPFKEHQHVQTIEVKVPSVSWEVVAPRSYSVVEHPARPAVRVPSLEQSYGKVCQTFS